MKMRLHKRISRSLRGRFRRRMLLKHGTAILADTWNGKLLVEAGDFAVGRTLLKEGAYDRREIEWLIDSLGGRGEQIVVVGSHIGSLLVPLSKHCEQIIGFEPDAGNYYLLGNNVLLNKADNAVIHNVAVGAYDGTAAFVRNDLNTGNSSVKLDGSEKDMLVDMLTLDTALATVARRIDLMVMDIEGHELYALQGAGRALNRTQRLYIEYAPEHLAAQDSKPLDLLRILGQHFSFLYTLGKNGEISVDTANGGIDKLKTLKPKRGLLRNLLFTKQELPEKALQKRS